MYRRLLPYFLITLLSLSALTGRGQGSPEYGSGMRFNLDPEGKKYVRLLTWAQIWARAGQQNPGTTVNGVPTDNVSDIGARRIRMLFQTQISPRYMIVFHIGINNQTFLNGGAAGTSGTGANGQGKKPGIFFHEAYNEYAVVPAGKNAEGNPRKGSLYVGAGLHYFNGISRMSSASTLNFLTTDVPIINWPLIENSDQFARQFGIYAKGKLGKLGYQFSMNKPFATNLTPPTTGTVVTPNVAVDNNGISKMAYGGYVDYQFLDQEANVLPYRVGTYVGTKRVFNIGAGFYTQPEGTASYNNSGQLQRHNINLFGLDLFADLPFGDKAKNAALTVYSVYYNYNFGPNYLRNIGIMNLGAADASFTGQRALAGPGNARPFVGTGSIWYTQAGILLPKAVEKPKMRVQPFAAYTYKAFDALPKAGSYYDMGLNLYIDGHNAKISPQYSLRPYYTDGNTIGGYKGEFIVQAQVYL